MQFNTLVTVAIGLIGYVVKADEYPPAPPAVTSCATITTAKNPFDCPTPLFCSSADCHTVVPITQSCGCPSIFTNSVCETACGPCQITYITAVADCFPTPPPYISSSTTTPVVTPGYPVYTPSTTPAPYYPVSTPSPPSYGNSTTTKTKYQTDIITVTSCPKYTTCVGQTVTYTSVEPCPSSTCTCVLPSVTYTTTNLPPPNTVVPVPNDTPTPEGNKPPPAVTSTKPPFMEANVAGKWGVGVGMGVFAGLFVAVMGFL